MSSCSSGAPSPGPAEDAVRLSRCLRIEPTEASDSAPISTARMLAASTRLASRPRNSRRLPTQVRKPCSGCGRRAITAMIRASGAGADGSAARTRDFLQQDARFALFFLSVDGCFDKLREFFPGR